MYYRAVIKYYAKANKYKLHKVYDENGKEVCLKVPLGTPRKMLEICEEGVFFNPRDGWVFPCAVEISNDSASKPESKPEQKIDLLKQTRNFLGK